MFSETTFLLVFGLGAICMLLGFFLVLRGIGAADSESSIKLIGVEIRASRVGPGVLFAMFGLVLIVTALGKQPGPPVEAKAPTPTPTEVVQKPQPPPPAVGTTTAAAGVGNEEAAEQIEPTSLPLERPPVDPSAARQSREAQLLRQFLADAAQGGCNAGILGPAPLMDCQRGIGMIQPQLVAAGPVQNVAYLASAQTPLGVADRFVVQHTGGQAVTWTGILGGDGRFLTLVSP